MKVALILLLVIGTVFAQSRDAEVRIVKQYFEDNGDGSYSWGYENSDGSAAEEKGFVKNPGAPLDELIIVKEGSYSYTDTDGKLIKIQYIGDDRGFTILSDNRRV